jgi:hypothetical protein
VERIMSRNQFLRTTIYTALFLFFGFFFYLTRPDQPKTFTTRLNQLSIGVERRILWWDGKDTEGEITCQSPGHSLKEPIPHVLHYVYLGTPDRPAEIPYRTYVAIKAALIRMRPDKVKMHIYRDGFNTSNIWWQKLQEHITLVEHYPEGMRGPQDRPMEDFVVQHQADFLRLEILWNEGGIYLDTDVFPLRPFTDLLSNDRDIIMGHEGGNRYGLGNAVIVARPRSEFIKRWIESYASFNRWVWNYHSIRMPKLLQVQYPALICPLSPSAFFWPTWAAAHHRYMHDPISSEEAAQLRAQMEMFGGSMYANQLAIHQGVNIDPQDQLLEDTRFNILMRDVLDAPIPRV